MRLPWSLLLFAVLPSGQCETWVQDSDTDFSQGILDGIKVDKSGSAATLKMESTSSIDTGFKYLARDWQHLWEMNFPQNKLSFRFIYQSTTTTVKVKYVWLFVHTHGISTVTYRASLETNAPDAATGGKPSGTPAGDGSNGLFGTKGDESGWDRWRWYRVTLTTPTALTQQTTYHIVISSDSIAKASAPEDFGYPWSGVPPYNGHMFAVPQPIDVVTSHGKSVPCTRALYWNGSSWSDPIWGTNYILELDDGTYEGNSMFYPYVEWPIYGGLQRGEVFTWQLPTVNINKITALFRTASFSPNPEDHLYVILENVTDGVFLIDEPSKVKIIDKAQSISGWKTPFTAELAGSLTIQEGKRYKLSFKSPLSSNSPGQNFYYIHLTHAGPWGPKSACGGVACPNNTARDAAIQGATFFGASANAYYETTNDMWSDAPFWFSQTVLRTSSTYESVVFDAELPSELLKISWEPATQPSGSALSLQVAGANSPSGPFAFVGPDGTPATTFAQPAGEPIKLFSGMRYFKWKALFSKAPNEFTPSLDKVSLELQGRPLPGTSLQLSNTPNPFQAGTEQTAIRYVLYKDSQVTIRIFTPSGELVKQWKLTPGSEGGKGTPSGYDNSVPWDGKNGVGMFCASGVYIAQIEVESADGSGTTVERRKIAIVR